MCPEETQFINECMMKNDCSMNSTIYNATLKVLIDRVVQITELTFFRFHIGWVDLIC
jgi:hypothetical protein